MKKVFVFFVSIFFAFSLVCVVPSFGRTGDQPGNADIKSEIKSLKKDVENLKQKLAEEENKTKNNNALSSAIAGLEITGGISGGYFYASNPGQDTSDDEFLLSNLLVEISSKKKESPLGFVAAFGETSTPSLFDAPEINSNYDIEYASLSLNPAKNVTLEAGLLMPNAGYEDTYTYNNRNIVLGAVASQQPYNAYGARVTYSVSGFDMIAGYYKSRLDDQEYSTDGKRAGDSWELGLAGSVSGFDFSVYNYHLKRMKNLTGVVIEHTVRNIYLALNVDYWRWDSSMRASYERRSSIGAAFYVSPSFGKISVPLRLEYIDQGKSRIYTDNTDARHIYTATITPTYHFSENAYMRIEGAYIGADGTFAEKDGDVKDGRVYVSMELGFVF